MWKPLGANTTGGTEENKHKTSRFSTAKHFLDSQKFYTVKDLKPMKYFRKSCDPLLAAGWHKSFTLSKNSNASSQAQNKLKKLSLKNSTLFTLLSFQKTQRSCGMAHSMCCWQQAITEKHFCGPWCRKQCIRDAALLF